MMPPRSPWPFRVLYAASIWLAIGTCIIDGFAPEWLGLSAALTMVALLAAWLALSWERRELPAWLEGWALRWPIYRPMPGVIYVPTTADRAQVERIWREGSRGRVVFCPYPDLAPGEGGEADERRRFP